MSTAQKTVTRRLPAAILEEVVATAMLEGDTRTNAAIAGVLAGAGCGETQVPKRWLTTL